MLRRIKELYGFTIRALDGDIGRVDDFLFDDTTWEIKDVVVQTDTWLSGRKVLIPPAALSPPSDQFSILPVKLTKHQVEHSPDIDTEKPVSMQHQFDLDIYYQSLPYGPAGYMPAYAPLVGWESFEEKRAASLARFDQHLQSTRSVTGYHIHATDRAFGHIEDFLIDDQIWLIRYLAIDTINWLPSKWVLVPASHVTDVNWDQHNVFIDLPAGKIKHAPPYHPELPLDHLYESQLNQYYSAMS